LSPIDRLLTESDGPVPYKPLNLIGSPGLIPQIVSEIAKIKQLTERDTAVQLDKNLKTILKTNH